MIWPCFCTTTVAESSSKTNDDSLEHLRRSHDVYRGSVNIKRSSFPRNVYDPCVRDDPKGANNGKQLAKRSDKDNIFKRNKASLSSSARPPSSGRDSRHNAPKIR